MMKCFLPISTPNSYSLDHLDVSVSFLRAALAVWMTDLCIGLPLGEVL